MRIKLPYMLKCKEITNFTNSLSSLHEDTVFQYISTDTRELYKNDLFIPLIGEKMNGEDYVALAKTLGAYTVSTTHSFADIITKNTEDFLLALSVLVKSKLTNLKYTLAITGSLGKTSTKEFCNHFLSEQFKVKKSEENHNNYIGVSETILNAPYDTEILLLEIGMNHSGEISKISKYIKPDMAVITNVGLCHIGNLGSRENIAKAKLEILHGMKNNSLIIPYEEVLLRDQGLFTFSKSNTKADFYTLTTDTSAKFYFRNNKIFETNCALPKGYLMNAILLAFSLSYCLELSSIQMKNAAEKIEQVNLRQKLIKIGNFIVFNDSYSSSPESVIENLKYLRASYPNAKISCLLGDMLELGTSACELHQYIGKQLLKYNINNLYTFGDFSDCIKDGAVIAGIKGNKIHQNPDKENHRLSAEQIFFNSEEGEIIMIKASHKLNAEKIIEILIDMVKENVR